MNQLYDSALLADAAYLFFNQGLYNTGTGEIDLQVASVFKDRGEVVSRTGGGRYSE